MIAEKLATASPENAVAQQVAVGTQSGVRRAGSTPACPVVRAPVVRAGGAPVCAHRAATRASTTATTTAANKQTATIKKR